MPKRRIFLSYAHDESLFVRSVADELRKRGVDPGFEPTEIEPGEALSQRLGDALRSSSVVVVFIGRSTDSPWMNFEIGAALGQSKVVVPVFLSHEARLTAPSVIRSFVGIDAYDLKPAEVAGEIERAIDSVAAAG